MPADSISVREKKKKVVAKPLTTTQKKKFLKAFKQIRLQIKELEHFAAKVSFRTI